MNILPTGASPRGDDAQGMYRRLLQDLERQWLDTWRVVGQEPSEADDAAGATVREGSPANETPLAGIVAGSHAVSASQTSDLPAGQLSPQHAPTNKVEEMLSGAGAVASSSDAFEAQASEAANETVGGAEPGSPIGLAGSESVFSEGQSRQASKSADMPLKKGLSSSAHWPDPVCGELAPRLEPVDSSWGKVGPGQPTVPVQGGALADSGRTAEASGRPSDSSQLHGSRASDLSGRIPTAMPAHGGRDGVEHPLESGSRQEASKRRLASTPHTAEEHGPQRLTLRELSENEVLASMRDSLLTPSQSQLAAQGLARALMEAGYAKVQVVVNGRPTTGLATNTRPEVGASLAVPPNPLQETDHGN